LETHRCPFDFNHFVSIVNPDRGDEFSGEYVLVKAEYEGCFPARGVAYHEEAHDVGSFGSHL
jgi:hypothetical protein